jgi:hypothetical protein
MKRSATILLIPLLCLALIAVATDSATTADPPRLARDAVYASVVWTPRISIARNALEEIRDRMARFNEAMGIVIVGPHTDDARAPVSLEEAWLLEKLYGRAQLWTIDIVPVEPFLKHKAESGEIFWRGTVLGVEVGVLTTKTPSRLHVELVGDSLRVNEFAA